MSRVYSLRSANFFRAANAVLAVLLLAAGYILVKDVKALFFAPASGRPAAPGAKAAAGPEARARRPLSEYSPVFKENPFGFAAGELKALSARRERGRGAGDLVLMGTVAARDGEGFAVFYRPGGAEELFRTGQAVWDAGVLKRVERGKALLAAPDGVVVEVVMREAAPEDGAGRGAAWPEREAPSDGAMPLDRTRVAQALDRMGDIMADARLTPRMVGGRQQGFTVNAPAPGGIFQRLGIRDGDAVLTVNGLEINDAESALQAFGALKSADRVTLGVIRNGSRITMTYRIR